MDNESGWEAVPPSPRATGILAVVAKGLDARPSVTRAPPGCGAVEWTEVGQGEWIDQAPTKGPRFLPLEETPMFLSPVVFKLHFFDLEKCLGESESSTHPHLLRPEQRPFLQTRTPREISSGQLLP